MSAAEPVLTVRHVTKSYGRSRVVAVEALDFHRHEAVLLHGRNGSGKSTLLRMLAGVSVPEHGAIARHGGLRHSPLGFLPQTGGLYVDLSVRQNLALRRRLHGLPVVPPIGFWYVEELNLTRFLDRRVGELSGGYQRLAGIAATLHAGPRWLLLDEPLNGVDAHARALLRERFATLVEKLDLCVIAAPSNDDDLVSARHIEVRDGTVE